MTDESLKFIQDAKHKATLKERYEQDLKYCLDRKRSDRTPFTSSPTKEQLEKVKEIQLTKLEKLKVALQFLEEHEISMYLTTIEISINEKDRMYKAEFANLKLC